MKPLNITGQALLESLISLPIMVTFCSAFLIGGHSLLTSFLVDHWIYESSFCLVQELSQKECSKNLRTKVAMIPFIRIKDLRLHKLREDIEAHLELSTPYLEHWHFKQQLEGSLNQKDFEGKF